MISAFDRWVLRDRCAIPGQSLPESELEFERQEETYQDQKAAWDACTIENNKPQTPETCHAKPPHPQWALESVTYPMNGAAENRCSICAELATAREGVLSEVVSIVANVMVTDLGKAQEVIIGEIHRLRAKG